MVAVHPLRSTEPFRKVLVANRGEIAVRILRCLRDLQIPSVTIYWGGERDALYVRMADEAHEIVGATASVAYQDVQQIVAICRRMNVDAVHPGYGFLSERADLARALALAGIRFIGPTPQVIELMGDKIAARQFAESLGIAVPRAVATDRAYAEFKDAPMPPFPLIVKAAKGGGGKGMCIVRSSDELQGSLNTATSDAHRYFGCGQVFLEEYIPNARHIEVQILGDGHRCIHLGERECSVQRRFQKIVEEAPSPALTEADRQTVCQMALRLATAAHYSSAGTIEFLFTPAGKFLFLEMNTRIQVEHPVTEMVSGFDLVAEQILIASGKRISYIQEDVRIRGHAIECRLCAEDPTDNFSPQVGRVLFLKEPHGPGIRVDSGLFLKQLISTEFDSMLAKIVVHAPSRAEAISKMIAAIKGFVLLGVSTNRELLQGIMEHPEFRAGMATTAFLATRTAELLAVKTSPLDLKAALAAAYIVDRGSRRYIDLIGEPYASIGKWSN